MDRHSSAHTLAAATLTYVKYVVLQRAGGGVKRTGGKSLLSCGYVADAKDLGHISTHETRAYYATKRRAAQADIPDPDRTHQVFLPPLRLAAQYRHGDPERRDLRRRAGRGGVPQARVACPARPGCPAARPSSPRRSICICYQDENFRVLGGRGDFYIGLDTQPAAMLEAAPGAAAAATGSTAQTVTIKAGQYHRFENASATEDLVVAAVPLTPERYEGEACFFRSFFGYLNDCKTSATEPSVFQLMVFLDAASTPLGIPLPWEPLEGASEPGGHDGRGLLGAVGTGIPDELSRFPSTMRKGNGGRGYRKGGEEGGEGSCQGSLEARGRPSVGLGGNPGRLRGLRKTVVSWTVSTEAATYSNKSNA